MPSSSPSSSSSARRSDRTPARSKGSCIDCGERHLRRSRLRRADWKHIAKGTWPVRCPGCNRRQYANWMRAFLAAPARTGRLILIEKLIDAIGLQAPGERKRTHKDQR